jgi:hypothetical protein
LEVLAQDEEVLIEREWGMREECVLSTIHASENPVKVPKVRLDGL